MKSILSTVGILIALPLSFALGNPSSESLEKLLASLGKEIPAFQTAEQLLSDGQTDAAAAKILTYFKSKQFDFDRLEVLALHSGRLLEAEKILLENKINLLEKEYPLWQNGSIEWDRTRNIRDKEWSWMINRHEFLLSLFAYYKETGDAESLVQINRILENWLDNNPYPDQLNFSPSWRALEVARRLLQVWVYLFYQLQPYEEFSPEVRVKFLASILDHADALKEHKSFWGGNHLLTELRALRTLAYAFPEFKESEQWRLYSEQRFTEELLAQSYPDGSYKELSNHYQRVVLLNAHEFLKLTDQSESPLKERVIQMWDYFHLVMRPDGFGPLNNASDLEHNLSFLSQRADFYKREDWKTPPKSGTESEIDLFPWAGQAILRNSQNSPDSRWTYFDFGPYGTAHQHRDLLHLSVAFDNSIFLADNGRYRYAPDKWSQYFKGPYSHNLALINGEASTRPPRELSRPLDPPFNKTESWAALTGKAFYASSPVALDSPAVHYRTLIQSPSSFLIVIDEILIFDSSEIEVIWNFGPNVTEQEAARGLTLLSDQDPIIIHSKGEENPPRGWYAPDYNLKQPALQKRYTFQTHSPITLVWLISNPNAEKPLIQVESSAPHEWRIEPQPELGIPSITYNSARSTTPFHIEEGNH